LRKSPINYLPLRIIVVASLLMEISRVFLIPSWTLWQHATAFIFQSSTLLFEWWLLTRINSYFDKVMPFAEGAGKRIIVQIILSVILLSPILFLVDALTPVFFGELEFMTPQFQSIMYVVFILVIAMINLSFYGSFFFKQWKDSIEEKAMLQVQAADAEKNKVLAQYHHLKNQVNPHFLFNTLTSLDGLIHSSPSLASSFVRHLAKVYRYVLEHSESEVVTIERELAFLNHYMPVLKIKHGESLHISVNVSPGAQEKGIAMVTSQMLIDNAIKHNIVHSKSPLRIEISNDADYLVFTNNKQLRQQIETSTKRGLKQLQELYQFLHESPVQIVDTGTSFTVKLPLL
jgi:two-component system, LytTR family, sensor kinase